MKVDKKNLQGCEVAVVQVEPSDNPPVKTDGRCWIRTGPRRAQATPEEERRLTEKRRGGNVPYDFFNDDKLAHAVQSLKNKKLKINLHDLYPDVDIAESLSNALGKPIRHRDAESVTFADGTMEKTNPAKMTEKEKQHFIATLKPYLWWGE